MLIVCPNCATSYDVDLARLGTSGRQVRCVRCRTVWHAELPHAEQLVAAAEALGPAPPVPPMVEAEPVPEMAVTEAAPETAAASDRLDEGPAEPVMSPMDDAASTEAADAANEPAIETESPPLAPTDLDAGASPPVEIETAEPEEPSRSPIEDIETVASRRRQARQSKDKQRWRWPLSILQTAMITLFVIDAIIVGWRTDFVRAMPETASFFAWIGMPVNLRGLDFDSVATTTEQHEGMPILVIGGNVVNDTNNTVNVPHLRFAVRNAAHQEIYSWTAVPARATLPPGEAIAFHTRLASPPPDAHDVLVRFLTRYDMLRGSH